MMSVIASSSESPQMSRMAGNDEQTAGLSSLPKMAHLLSAVRLTHRTPAGLPFGIPGMLDEMLMATQQTPQARQFIGASQ